MTEFFDKETHKMQEALSQILAAEGHNDQLSEYLRKSIFYVYPMIHYHQSIVFYGESGRHKSLFIKLLACLSEKLNAA